ncbi:MAG: hypothetical protein LBM95_07445 [Lactobacillales bacterium]|jgi:niacin transporter|nr:hypothetical protein [Lactobacillales bacterium]
MNKGNKEKLRHLVIGALLVAIGILIPQVMPKIPIPPASFTLASHVPIFIGMFFSPFVAVMVVIGTTFGFFISGLPPVIAARAASHIIFAIIGAFYLRRHPEIVNFKGKNTLANWKFQFFNLWIGVIHALSEVAVVSVFFLFGTVPGATSGNFVYMLVVLVGVGGLIHSLVDYNIAYVLSVALSKSFDIDVFVAAKKKKEEVEKTSAIPEV